ncbi:SET domain-containing protein-like protein [Emericellopsis cladophorae]|uniref:SET domain-containing protein-like protein n=1 Tax=Emericellopsis cladophorae TaxID=2686198 RepID=A0A9Q0BEC0_9HYPO|nr:SET domain-containing protein-like protein [Emericellopsis cladophorae]KAI6781701.1 SET domain-containing protein-like protein [Emericellopsis cladophorae]
MPANPGPIEGLPVWQRLHGVQFHKCELQLIKDKGTGLVATEPLSLVADEEGFKNDRPLLTVPRGLALSAEAVREYANVDNHFRELLNATGHETARGKIMLYLLVHLVRSRQTPSDSHRVAASPWTDYIKYLERDGLLPSMWSEGERNLLQGTSLEQAVAAKRNSLNQELEELCEKTKQLDFWNELFWEQRKISFEDWALVDAWYRSRCLELPSSGDAMVPSIDMANHSYDPEAYYDEDSDGDIEILLRPGYSVDPGKEVTISYGKLKRASEMLFSYGFIDKAYSTDEMTLMVRSFEDDPLSRAKEHIFGGMPTVQLRRTDGVLKWHSPFLHLMCLNEEDGLDFRILQDNEGGRQLRMFWQDKDVTERAADFEELTREHELCSVFRLRAVSILLQQMVDQLGRLRRAPQYEDGNPIHVDASDLRPVCVQAAATLKEIEGSLLEATVAALEKEQQDLLADERVKAYLGSMEEAPMGTAPSNAANEDVDFS